MDKKSLYLCLSLFIISLVVGYTVCSFTNVFINNDEDVIDDIETDNKEDEQLNDGVNNVIDDQDDLKPATDVYKELIHYSGSYIDLSKKIIDFDDNIEHNDKLLSLTVDNIKVSGKEYTFSFKNHPQHCALDYNYMREGYNEFYINDKLIYSQVNQACYLERLHYVTIIDNKYIGITFEGQNGNIMYVYDGDIILVDTVDYKEININNEGILFSQYADDNGCVLYNYIYDEVDGKLMKTFKSKVNNIECDELNNKGCNC